MILKQNTIDAVLEHLDIKIGADVAIRALLTTDEHFTAMFKVLRDTTDTHDAWNVMGSALDTYSEKDQLTFKRYGALRTAKCRTQAKKPPKSNYEKIMALLAKNDLSQDQYSAIEAKVKCNKLENQLAA